MVFNLLALKREELFEGKGCYKQSNEATQGVNRHFDLCCWPQRCDSTLVCANARL